MFPVKKHFVLVLSFGRVGQNRAPLACKASFPQLPLCSGEDSGLCLAFWIAAPECPHLRVFSSLRGLQLRFATFVGFGDRDVDLDLGMILLSFLGLCSHSLRIQHILLCPLPVMVPGASRFPFPSVIRTTVGQSQDSALCPVPRAARDWRHSVAERPLSALCLFSLSWHLGSSRWSALVSSLMFYQFLVDLSGSISLL